MNAIGFSNKKNAHSKGTVQIAFDKSGYSKNLLTCGTDGSVIAWDEESLLGSRDPEKHDNLAYATHASIAWTGDNLFLGVTRTAALTSIDEQVLSHFDMNKLKGPPLASPLTFTLEISAIDASENFLVVGERDFTVKRIRWHAEDSDYERYECAAPVLSIAIDPKEEYFAVSSCDGVVAFYNFEAEEPLKKLKECFPYFNDLDESHPRVSLCWSPDGLDLFVPALGSVKIVKRTTWSYAQPLTCDETMNDSFSVCTVSPCGQYLAASTVSSKIVVWRLKDRKVLTKKDYRKLRNATITSICFLPENSHHLVVADYQEGICVLSNAIPAEDKEEDRPRPASSRFIDDEAGESDRDDEREEEEVRDEGEERNDRDADNEEIVKSKTKRRTAMFDDDDENTNMSTSIGAIKRTYGYDDEGNQIEPERDFMDDIDNRDPSRPRPPTDFSRLDVGLPSTTTYVDYKPPKLPEYFVSAASPAYLSERYLKWNGFGTVRSYDSESETSVEVHFHDSSIHADILLPNGETEFCLADLNAFVVALANRKKSESSQLHVLHIASWESNGAKWTVDLPAGDLPLDVAVSSELIVLATSQRTLRVFTHAGTQRYVVTHPYPLLTMAAFESRIAVASYTGSAMFLVDGEEPEFPLAIYEYSLPPASWWKSRRSSASLDSPLPVALSPSSRLLWLSYSNGGHLVTLDSTYTVRFLVTSPSLPPFWTPIFSGSTAVTSPSDAVWPLAVMDSPQKQIRYVYCKGAKYPMVTLKLHPVVSPWTLSLCNQEADKTKLEAELMLNEFAIALSSGGENKELTSSHLVNLVKLFSLACKAERETRAAELAMLATTSKAVQPLANYAAKLTRQKLADKVGEIGRALAELEEAEAEAADTMRMAAPAYYRPASSMSILESSFQQPTSERVVAKKVALRRSSTLVGRGLRASEASYSREFSEENAVGPSSSALSQTTTHDEYEEEEPSSMASSIVHGLPMAATPLVTRRNPFKRGAPDENDSAESQESAADTSSVSLFDELDRSAVPQRKRMKETQNTTIPQARKQLTLNFGSAAGKTSDTSTSASTSKSAFDMWKEENDGDLRSQFSGEDEDFAKFCIQQFRMIPAAKRQEYKERAKIAVAEA